MNHVMSLKERPFHLIRDRMKKIEIRCNDEKRQKVKVGDTITFEKLPDRNETLTAEVMGLYPFPTFQELYESFDFSEFGCAGDSMDLMLSGTRKLYSQEKEAKYGALGIRIRLIDAEFKK